MDNIEILAPAGSYESFEAALSAGADAVYLGASRFGARAFADNLTDEVLMQAIDKAHILNKKLYLTVNTLFKQNEIEQLYDFLLPFYKEGLDAVIVQDVGAFKTIRECFPDLPIHASTQMTITGFEGAKLMEQLGATRVVPARELSYKEISLIRDMTDLEIECFVHGALCYSYSGACLMSSFIGGRSGNRGRCAQPCRLPYSVISTDGIVSDDTCAYALNTKDMCLIDEIPNLIEAGVTSFKIEGRMKRPEYSAGAVSMYRKYLDLYLENRDKAAFSVRKQDKELLFDLFNRDGFNKSYYSQHNGRNMMALKNEKNSGVRLNKVEKAYETLRNTVLSNAPKRSVQAHFKLDENKTAVLELESGEIKASACSNDAQAALSRPLDEEMVTRQLSKTGGTDFVIDALKTELADGMFMTAGQLNSLRRDAFEKLKNEILLQHKRNGAAKKSDMPNKTQNDVENKKLYVKVSSIEQLNILEKNLDIDGFYVPLRFVTDEFVEERCDGIGNGRYTVELPLISRPDSLHESDEKYDKGNRYRGRLIKLVVLGFKLLVHSMEDAAFLINYGIGDSLILDYSMYTMNDEAVSFWRDKGIGKITIPLELNKGEIYGRDNSESELVVYGRVPLMISTQCIRKNYKTCTRSYGSWTLKDRKGAEFPVAFDCTNCCNIIYNSVPISLLSLMDDKMLGRFENYRLEFTIEDSKDVAIIADNAARIIKHSEITEKEQFKYTRGHYNRGIE